MRITPEESGDAVQTTFGARDRWQISSVGISNSEKVFEVLFDYLYADVEKCPFCGAKLVDTSFSTKKTWSHINFFQYKTRMTACLPIFRCSNDNCVARSDREAVVNTLFLDVLLMVSHFDVNSALRTLLAAKEPKPDFEQPRGVPDVFS